MSPQRSMSRLGSSAPEGIFQEYYYVRTCAGLYDHLAFHGDRSAASQTTGLSEKYTYTLDCLFAE